MGRWEKEGWIGGLNWWSISRDQLHFQSLWHFLKKKCHMYFLFSCTVYADAPTDHDGSDLFFKSEFVFCRKRFASGCNWGWGEMALWRINVILDHNCSPSPDLFIHGPLVASTFPARLTPSSNFLSHQETWFLWRCSVWLHLWHSCWPWFPPVLTHRRIWCALHLPCVTYSKSEFYLLTITVLLASASGLVQLHILQQCFWPHQLWSTLVPHSLSLSSTLLSVLAMQARSLSALFDLVLRHQFRWSGGIKRAHNYSSLGCNVCWVFWYNWL